jgi:hypothetical protein
MPSKCKSKKLSIPIRCGSAEPLYLFYGEWAERRGAVGEIDLMNKGLRHNKGYTFIFITFLLERLT